MLYLESKSAEIACRIDGWKGRVNDMSVVVKGMEMPSDCSNCIFKTVIGVDIWKCNASGEEFHAWDVGWGDKPYIRHSSCPLVPVPLVEEESELKVEISHELEAALISAERYALGRRTYIVSQTVDYLISLLPHLSEWFLVNVLADLENQVKHGIESFGDFCDYQDWARLWARIRDELKERKSK